jgi:hypothetical protein
MAARIGPIPQEVCPSSDNPLLWLHRFGWALLDRRTWPDDAMNNPVIFYLLGRRRWTFLDDMIGLMAWAGLFAVETGALVYLVVSKSMRMWFLLIPFEILLLPILFGVWAQISVLLHYQRFRAKVPIEELLSTRLRSRDVLFGFAMRPISLQVGANALLTLVQVAVVLFSGVILNLMNSLYSQVDFVIVAVALVYRYFLLAVSIELASIHAIRACLFIPDQFKLVTRMVRDWVFPWGLIPLGFALAAGVFFYLFFVIPGIMCFASPFVLIGGVWLIWAMPGVLRSFAEEEFFWMDARHADWTIRTGEEPDIVPRGLFDRWKLERRIPAKARSSVSASR